MKRRLGQPQPSPSSSTAVEQTRHVDLTTFHTSHRDRHLKGHWPQCLTQWLSGSTTPYRATMVVSEARSVSPLPYSCCSCYGGESVLCAWCTSQLWLSRRQILCIAGCTGTLGELLTSKTNGQNKTFSDHRHNPPVSARSPNKVSWCYQD